MCSSCACALRISVQSLLAFDELDIPFTDFIVDLTEWKVLIPLVNRFLVFDVVHGLLKVSQLSHIPQILVFLLLPISLSSVCSQQSWHVISFERWLALHRVISRVCLFIRHLLAIRSLLGIRFDSLRVLCINSRDLRYNNFSLLLLDFLCQTLNISFVKVLVIGAPIANNEINIRFNKFNLC